MDDDTTLEQWKWCGLQYHAALLSIASSDCVKCAPIAQEHLMRIAREYPDAPSERRSTETDTGRHGYSWNDND